ncbi:MAG: hypothetical protein WCD79_01325 [Chthoniobacteraceae bacterium]
MKALIVVLVGVLYLCAVRPATAGPAPHEDISIGSLPAESVTAALRKMLSPQGRFVILAVNGTVRIFDTPAKIDEARKVLQDLRNAPAMVSFAISVRTGMQRVQESPNPGPVDYEIPVPQTYGAPRIAAGQGGNGTVVPGNPGNFTTRHVAPGERVYVNPGYVTGGYVTGTEVQVQRTSVEGGVNHNYAGSTVFPKPVAVTVATAVNDPEGLHDWAIKNGAVPANEPAWINAGTEIVVTPEHGDNGLLLNMTPQIVLPGAPGQAARRIPIKVCATSVLTKPGAPAKLEGFPGADAAFYRLFLGAQDSVEGTSTLITVAAGMNYTASTGSK